MVPQQPSTRPASAPSTRADRLRPPNGRLYVVRWIKGTRGDVTHRYFRRPHDAKAYASKLRGYGKPVAVYFSVTSWEPTQ